MRSPLAVLRVSVVVALVTLGCASALWACSSSGGGDGGSLHDGGSQTTDATATSTDAEPTTPDAAKSVDAGPAECDARIVECVTNPTQKSPTVNVPSACGAPAFDAYSTTDNEQVEAACNAFCVQQNPAFVDAGGFVGCNESPAEQALGTGAFHCVCAP
jgi:hypothetical protein